MLLSLMMIMTMMADNDEWDDYVCVILIGEFNCKWWKTKTSLLYTCANKYGRDSMPRLCFSRLEFTYISMGIIMLLCIAIYVELQFAHTWIERRWWFCYKHEYSGSAILYPRHVILLRFSSHFLDICLLRLFFGIFKYMGKRWTYPKNKQKELSIKHKT